MSRPARLVLVVLVVLLSCSATSMADARPAAGAHRPTVTWKAFGKIRFDESLKSAAKAAHGKVVAPGCPGLKYIALRTYVGVSVDNGFSGARTVRRMMTSYPEVRFPRGVRAGATFQQTKRALGRDMHVLNRDGVRYAYVSGPHGRVLWAVFFGSRTSSDVGITANLKELKEFGATDGCGGA